jgi:perosamine synthetase
MTDRYISLYLASIDARRAAYLMRAWLTSPWQSSARQRLELAAQVSGHLGAVETFAYASGRGALAACLRAAGIGPGHTVLVSAFTCLAVPTAVLAVGARPEYVDIEASSLNTPADAVIAALRADVRAVVVQHTLGRAADIEPIAAAARQRGVLVIEDCALAAGSRRLGRPLGTAADAAIFSLELSKTISSGWGGVLAVRDRSLARQVADDYERTPEPGAGSTARRVVQAAMSGACYEPAVFPLGRYAVAGAFKLGLFKPSTPAAEFDGHPDASFIARLSGAQAALAAVQWRRLHELAPRCAANAERLRAALDRAGLAVVARPEPGDLSVTPRVPFLVSDPARALRWFADRAVELGTWFDGPLSPLPDPLIFNYDPSRYPRAVSVARRIVNLAAHCGLTDADVTRMAELASRFVAECPDQRHAA